MGEGSVAIPYCGAAPAPAELMSRWNWDPWLLIALVAAAFALGLYVRRPERPIAVLAMGLLVLAFVSPLCALSSGLFAARTVHHVVLVALAAPLFALLIRRSHPIGIALPLAASTITLWLWHVPGVYTAALNHHALYWLMQASLLGTAIWFWRAIFSARAALPAAMVSLGAAVGQMGLLGALLTFAPRPLYPHHLIAPLAYGLDPLQDQQLAGLIMWVPAMLPYALIAALLARRAWGSGWLRPAA